MPVPITQVTIIFFNQILYRSTLLVDPNFFLQDLKEREKKVMHFGSSLLGVKACSILSGCHDQRAANLVCQVHFCKLLNQSKHLGRTSLNCFKRFIPTIVFLILIWNLCNLCMYTKKKCFELGMVAQNYGFIKKMQQKSIMILLSRSSFDVPLFSSLLPPYTLFV